MKSSFEIYKGTTISKYKWYFKNFLHQINRKLGIFAQSARVYIVPTKTLLLRSSETLMGNKKK